MKLKSIIASMMLGVMMTPAAWADANDMSAMMQLMEQFKNQMSEMQQTIDQQNQKIAQLEGRTSFSIPSTSESSSGAAEATPPMSDYEFNERLGNALGGANKWLKNLNAKGDLRLRYEAFQNTSGNTGENDDRNRFRYRLRYGLEKKFSDELATGFSLASGEFPTMSGTTAGSAVAQSDPTSTNTTFDNNFNYKPIYIEKAYASYSPAFLKKGPIKKATIKGGKMDNDFEKGSSDIIWDRDVKPEGAIEKIDLNLVDSDDFDLGAYITAGQFILDEDGTSSSAAGDAELYAFQIGINPVVYTPMFERPVDLLSAVSYYSYNDYATNGNFTIGGASLARGNGNILGAATDLDVQDFEILEYYNELAVYPGGLPVRPFMDLAWNLNSAMNSETSAFGGIGTEENNAWAFGVKLGSIVQKGDWELSYANKWIGSNSVPGFNDSDLGFSGHSGRRGNVFKGSYALTDAMTLNLAAFFVQNLNEGTSTIIDEEQRRFQLDLVWKF